MSRGPYAHLYDSRRWRRRSRLHLLHNGLCVMCDANGDVVPATVCHHVNQHKGNINEFFLGEIVGLCTHHHDCVAQGIEKRGFDNEIGVDGWPTDKAHHQVYKTERA
jgi:5-methylcytosine-specific restriction protein A